MYLVFRTFSMFRKSSCWLSGALVSSDPGRRVGAGALASHSFVNSCGLWQQRNIWKTATAVAMTLPPRARLDQGSFCSSHRVTFNKCVTDLSAWKTIFGRPFCPGRPVKDPHFRWTLTSKNRRCFKRIFVTFVTPNIFYAKEKKYIGKVLEIVYVLGGRWCL